MSNGKYRIHQFENGIYPLRLYIVVDNRLDCFVDSFEEVNGKEVNVSDVTNTTSAFTYEVGVAQKNDNTGWGVVMVFKKKTYMTTKDIAHESTHAAFVMAHILGLQYHSGEANEEFAYLIGWIADCCYQVKNFKEKSNGEETKGENKD